MNENPFAPKEAAKKRVITVSVTAAQNEAFEQMKLDLGYTTDGALIKRGLELVWAELHRQSASFCTQCGGPFPLTEWPGRQYAGHSDSCPNRPKGAVDPESEKEPDRFCEIRITTSLDSPKCRQPASHRRDNGLWACAEHMFVGTPGTMTAAEILREKRRSEGRELFDEVDRTPLHDEKGAQTRWAEPDETVEAAGREA